ncbi:MAG TPA: hypothetical protein VFY32_04270 [Solirubrobacteraceae bacterium]|nr:hypothetical protein [Solirubrobacteraceae bacterium]
MTEMAQPAPAAPEHTFMQRMPDGIERLGNKTNLMVMEPGGYRFGDYWKLGLPLLALFGVVAIGLVPVFWPL